MASRSGHAGRAESRRREAAGRARDARRVLSRAADGLRESGQRVSGQRLVCFDEVTLKLDLSVNYTF